MTNADIQNTPIKITTTKSLSEMDDNTDLITSMKAIWETSLAAAQANDHNSSEQGNFSVYILHVDNNYFLGSFFIH